MDISADLTELGRNPVTVVSSGVKSILDIERTLEYLVSFAYGCKLYSSPSIITMMKSLRMRWTGHVA
jgi:pseudouridine-5'-phosphate glycosidase/pseudouridine kinase